MLSLHLRLYTHVAGDGQPGKDTTAADVDVDDFLSFRPNYAKKSSLPVLLASHGVFHHRPGSPMPTSPSTATDASPAQSQAQQLQQQQQQSLQPHDHKRITYDRDFVMSFKSIYVSVCFLARLRG